METYIQNRILQQTDNMPFALGTLKSKNTSIDWFICIYIYTYIYTHIYIHIYIHTYVSTHQRGYVHKLRVKTVSTNWNEKQFKVFQHAPPRMKFTAGCGANSCCSRRQEGLSACLVLHKAYKKIQLPSKAAFEILTSFGTHRTPLPVHVEVSWYHSPGFPESRSLQEQLGTSWPGLAGQGLGNGMHTFTMYKLQTFACP